MIRIGVTGPESTGKSTLSKELQKHYNCAMVDEFARDYLEKRGGKYGINDLDIIAQNQFNNIHSVFPNQQLLVCDTELTVLKIWSEFKYDSCSPIIQQLLNKQQIDYYFLCDIDLPWEEDPLREHPNQRGELFELYQQSLDNRKCNYTILKGDNKQRLTQAVKIIDELLSTI